MPTINDARKHWQKVSGQYRRNMPTRTVLSGDGRGSAASNLVVGRNSRYIYAHEYNSDSYFIVLNPEGKAGPYVNMPIKLGYEPDKYSQEEVVLGINYDALPSGWGGSGIYSIGHHAQQHMFRGGDEVFVDSRLFMPGLVAPTAPVSMQVDIRPLIYYYSSWQRLGATTTKDLTEYVPVDGARFLLIAIDPGNNTVVYRPGFSFSAPATPTAVIGGASAGGFSATPAPAGGEIPLALIYLTTTTTVIGWSAINDNIFDARLFAAPSMKAILDRLDQLEGQSGNSPSLPVTGAA